MDETRDGLSYEIAANSASDLIKALNHAIRRSILRFLLESAPATPAQIRRGIPIFVGTGLNFHLEILVATGTVTRVRTEVGRKEGFYSPTEAIQTSWFLDVLQLTAGED
jgi:predicted ArsR family transcriptional regulator